MIRNEVSSCRDFLKNFPPWLCSHPKLYDRHIGPVGYSTVRRAHAQGLFGISGEVSKSRKYSRQNASLGLTALDHKDTNVLQSITYAKIAIVTRHTKFWEKTTNACKTSIESPSEPRTFVTEFGLSC